MPCNLAVAITKAVVSEAQLIALLTPEIVQALMELAFSGQAATIRQADVPFQVWAGSVRLGEQAVRPHIWLTVGHLRIDFRLRMWLSELPTVPHGVVKPAEWPDVVYDGEPIAWDVVGEAIFRVLTTPLPELPFPGGLR